MCSQDHDSFMYSAREDAYMSNWLQIVSVLPILARYMSLAMSKPSYDRAPSECFTMECCNGKQLYGRNQEHNHFAHHLERIRSDVQILQE